MTIESVTPPQTQSAVASASNHTSSKQASSGVISLIETAGSVVKASADGQSGSERAHKIDVYA